MKIFQFIIFIFVCLPTARVLYAVAGNSFQQRVSCHTSYFLDNERIRHNRYELLIKQKTKITTKLNTFIAGRFRADMALYPDKNIGPQSGLPESVRNDEYTEAEPREVYLDYLSTSYRLTAGLQIIDWIDSLSPLTSDVITPLDLRFGGFGNAEDVIVPVLALNLNHMFLGGTLDWLVVPIGTHHRYPKEENGYGLYSSFYRTEQDSTAEIEEESIPKTPKNSEAGLRYIIYLGGFDITMLAYAGHQRSPTSEIWMASESDVDVKLKYPILTTYGLTFANSIDPFVFRLLSFYEPHRAPPFELHQFNPQTGTYVNSPILYQTRQRVGLGMDFVLSKHFKFYSEHYLNILNSIYTKGYQLADDEKNPKRQNQSSIRITNETFSDVFASVEATFISPEKSQMITPHISFTIWQNYQLGIGAHLIKTSDKESPVYSLRETNQVYADLIGFLDANSFSTYRKPLMQNRKTILPNTKRKYIRKFIKKRKTVKSQDPMSY